MLFSVSLCLCGISEKSLLFTPPVFMFQRSNLPGLIPLSRRRSHRSVPRTHCLGLFSHRLVPRIHRLGLFSHRLVPRIHRLGLFSHRPVPRTHRLGPFSHRLVPRIHCLVPDNHRLNLFSHRRAPRCGPNDSHGGDPPATLHCSPPVSIGIKKIPVSSRILALAPKRIFMVNSDPAAYFQFSSKYLSASTHHKP